MMERGRSRWMERKGNGGEKAERGKGEKNERAKGRTGEQAKECGLSVMELRKLHRESGRIPSMVEYKTACYKSYMREQVQRGLTHEQTDKGSD